MAAPLAVIRRAAGDLGREVRAARRWVLALACLPLLLVLGLAQVLPWALLVSHAATPVQPVANAGLFLAIGLGVFGAVFAVNSALHSFLILAYAKVEDVAMDVGFYYMANAAGRLVGCLLSGLVYQWAGLTGSLVAAALFLVAAWLVSQTLPVAHPLEAPAAGTI